MSNFTETGTHLTGFKNLWGVKKELVMKYEVLIEDSFYHIVNCGIKEKTFLSKPINLYR